MSIRRLAVALFAAVVLCVGVPASAQLKWALTPGGRLLLTDPRITTAPNTTAERTSALTYPVDVDIDLNFGQLTGLATDPETGQLWLAQNARGVTTFYPLNPADGSVGTPVAIFDRAFSDIVFGADGTLFASTSMCDFTDPLALYRVDLVAGTTERVAGFVASVQGCFGDDLGALAIRKDGTLFHAFDSGDALTIEQVNIGAGTTTVVYQAQEFFFPTAATFLPNGRLRLVSSAAVLELPGTFASAAEIGNLVDPQTIDPEGSFVRVAGLAEADVACKPTAFAHCISGRFKVSVSGASPKARIVHVPRHPDIAQFNAEDSVVSVAVKNNCSEDDEIVVTAANLSEANVKVTVSDRETDKNIVLQVAAGSAKTSTLGCS